MFIHRPPLRAEQLSWCVESKQANVDPPHPPTTNTTPPPLLLLFFFLFPPLMAGFWSSAMSIVKLGTVRRALTRVHSWI